MKKYAILLLGLALLSGCQKNNLPSEDITPNQQEVQQPEQQEQEPNSSEGVTYSFDYHYIHFSHSPDETTKVTITYPQFKDEKLADVNVKIENFAKAKFKNVMNNLSNETPEITLDETYSITLSNQTLISILGEGTLLISGTPYPTTTSSTLNMNPSTLQEYTTLDLLNITDDFVALFQNNASALTEFYDYLSTFTREEIKTALTKSQVYFSDDNLIIRYEVPHALGDFVEVSFDHDSIAEYLMNS